MYKNSRITRNFKFKKISYDNRSNKNEPNSSINQNSFIKFNSFTYHYNQFTNFFFIRVRFIVNYFEFNGLVKSIERCFTRNNILQGVFILITRSIISFNILN